MDSGYLASGIVSGIELRDADLNHLARAQNLAAEGWGRVHPNPMVGCVLVRDGEVVGEGAHVEFGGPHAEVRALQEAGERAAGATAYVTLEPCNHFGLTPPCTRALADAHVGRVVFGARDPGSVSSGGARALVDAGLEVVGPVYRPALARRFNPAFFQAATKRSPFVAIKLAVTLDGRIAAAAGQRTRITGSEAQEHAHYLRAGFDALMVGSGTVTADDPLLTVRGTLRPRIPPVRIVLDSRGRLSVRAAVFRDVGTVPLTVFTGEDAAETRLEALEAAGAAVHPVASTAGGLRLEAVLDRCWMLGYRSILCEGGGRLASSLIREGLASRIYLFVSPFVLGGGVLAFPDLSDRRIWEGWTSVPFGGTFGRDALIVFDREE